ncbi:MAG: 2'-5' RNA ligase family protein [Microbacteriaceae bacterium]
MPRLVVVLPLQPLGIGERFAVHHWPLHITVLAPFLTDAPPERIAAAIEQATASQKAFTAVAGHDELFGRRHNVPVTVIEDNDDITALHETLSEVVQPFAAVPEEAAFTGKGFRAHVTVKRHDRVHAGDVMMLRQIALVDMSPRTDPGGRSVLATRILPAD